MRKLLVIICLTALPLLASEVRLAWDASLTQGVTNYVLYAHTNDLAAVSLTNALVKLNVGTNLTARVESLVPGRWWFGATAMKDGMESDLSNTISVEVPRPPRNMRTVVILSSATVTNWTNIFFKLRID